MRRALLLGLCAFAAGCGHAQLKLDWADAAVAKYDPKAYPDDGAVVLHRSDHVQMIRVDRNTSYHAYARHELVALQTEAGFDQAEVKIPFRATDKVVELKARIKRPGTPWEDLDPALLLTDADATGEHDVNARFFRFPRIEPGTLIEYAYSIEGSGLHVGSEQDTLGQYPVREYQFELIASKELVITTTAYNSTTPIRTEALPDGTNRLSSEIRDIPHRPKEDFAPHWTFTEPRWTWRLMGVEYANKLWPSWNTWNAVMWSQAPDDYGVEGKKFDGYSAKLDTGGCKDVACKVETARQFLIAHAVFKTGAATPRPMKEVLEAASANGFERALLMRRLLADAGVDARLAYTTRHWSEQVDPKFPGYWRLNELLVWLPPQDGLKAGAWLSPRCDYCGLNELPAELRGLDALVFTATKSPMKLEADVTSEWRSTSNAQPAKASKSLYTHKATLSADGSLFDEFREHDEGSEAAEEEIKNRMQTRGERLVQERNSVTDRSAIGVLSEMLPKQCDPRSGECDFGKRFVLPAYATAESDRRLLVPLNALSLAFNKTMAAPKERRLAPMHFQRAAEFEEIFDFEAPAGYVLEQTPKPVAVKTALVETTVKVEATPKGARVTRRLVESIGGAQLEQYDQNREAFRAWQDARQWVLSFVKK